MDRKLAAAFLAGLGTLALQSAAFGALSVQLGTSLGAGSVALSATLAGMGAGWWVFGRWRLRLLDERRGAALALGLAGLTAACTVPVLAMLERLVASGRLPSAWTFQALAAGAALVIPNFFAASAVPLLNRRPGPAGSPSFGALYGWNTLGSVAGLLVAAFGAVPRLGLAATGFLSGAALLAGGAFGWFCGGDEEAAEAPSKRQGKPRGERLSRKWALSLSAVSGFCGLALEVVWLRVLASFLPNRQAGFAIVLAIYLAGYGLGSLRAVKAARAPGRALRSLKASLAGIALLSALAVPLVRFLPEVLFAMRSWLVVPWRQAFVPPALLALVLVFPSAVLMGGVPALLVALRPSVAGSRSREAGLLLASNTAGSILGSLGAGLVLVPFIGALRTALLAGLLYGLGTWGLQMVRLEGAGDGREEKARPRTGRKRLAVLAGRGEGKAARWAAAAAVLAGATLLIMPALLPKPLPVSVFRDVTRADRLLFYRESAEGTVSVLEDARSGVRWSYVNSSAVCGTTYDALKAVRMLAHLPMLVHPDPRRVLVIGFGLGVTAGNVLSYSADRVDCVELCPEVSRAAPLFEPYNRKVIGDGRIHIHGGDGRDWLKRSGARFDVITCDPTHPALGSGNLYTREFFSLAAAHLAEGGVFVQYYPFRYLAPQELRAAVETFRASFAHASLWLGYSHGVMLGCDRPLSLDPADWERRLAGNPALYDLRRSNLSRAQDWLSLVLMGPEELEVYGRGAPLVVDDRPVLAYPALSSLDPSSWAAGEEALAAFRTPEAALALVRPESRGDPAFRGLFDRFFAAKTVMIGGNIARSRGDLEGAERLLRRARGMNWDDAEIRETHEAVLRELGAMRLEDYLGHP